MKGELGSLDMVSEVPPSGEQRAAETPVVGKSCGCLRISGCLRICGPCNSLELWHLSYFSPVGCICAVWGAGGLCRNISVLLVRQSAVGCQTQRLLVSLASLEFLHSVFNI